MFHPKQFIKHDKQHYNPMLNISYPIGFCRRENDIFFSSYGIYSVVVNLCVAVSNTERQFSRMAAFLQPRFRSHSTALSQLGVTWSFWRSFPVR